MPRVCWVVIKPPLLYCLAVVTDGCPTTNQRSLRVCCVHNPGRLGVWKGGGGALSTWSKTLLKRIIVRQLCSSAIDFPNALSTQNIIIYVSMTNITILFDILKSISTQPDARDALLAQFSLHVHKGCLKPHSLHFNFSRDASVCIQSNIYIISHVSNMPPLAIYKPFILLPLTILLPVKHDHPRFLCVISRLNNSYLE